ncbi:MAG: A/G-specific adenine glycosylase [Prolixibacteraceae bacterium]
MDEYRKVLTAWYNANKRELPWRGTADPYKIWVSEVILQQTRVQQGMEYYHNFLLAFPDVKSLAGAPEEEVLKVWQGLGYYSRARNMHHAARTILNNYGGTFPMDYASIRNLKGIGDYTAAAIASIAFNLPYAVVDGNVFRVLSRLFGLSTPIDSPSGKKEFYALAQEMLDTSRPGDFNQALMEFGAIQCIPGQPDCESCPLSPQCYACLNQDISSFPVKTNRVKQRERHLNYLCINWNDKLLLEKRGERDIWRNLYQFPLIETTLAKSPEEVINSAEWRVIVGNRRITLNSVSEVRTHILTHQRLMIRYFLLTMNGEELPDGTIAVSKSEIEKFAVPKPVEQFLLQMGY